MGAIKRINRRMWVIPIVGLIIQILLDPLSSLLNFSEYIKARVALPGARAKWEEQNFAHYSFDIAVRSSTCILDARVEVRNGQVAQVNPIDSFGHGEVLDEPLPPTGWATSNPYLFICDYTNFTMPKFFDELGQSLQSITRISFDSKYGFVSSVRFGTPGGQGLFGSKISDCCSNFEIQNFQIVEK
jgi:uncharacterized protein DUF6174